MDDDELLQEYAAHRSERAFTELVGKQLPFVYATALRLVRDAAAAEDVAQSVFIDLARKAWMVRPGTLPGWLYRATQRAAYMAIRSENRRRQRETEAMNLAEQNRDSPANGENLVPLLDEALRQLNRIEQDALLLRYFDGRSISETGRLLSLSEPAAQKRVSRALEKMRAHFARQGVTASAALLATTLGTHAAVPPPTGLAGKITGPALASATTQVGGAGVFYLLFRIIFMSTKTTLTVATLAALIVFTIAGIWWYNQAVPRSEKITLKVAESKSLLDPKSAALLSSPTAPIVSPPSKVLQSPMVAHSGSTDPRVEQAKAELQPLIADMVRQFEAGDAAGAMLSHLPPDMQDEISPPTPIDINNLNLPPDQLAKFASQMTEMKQQMADEKAAFNSDPVIQGELVVYKAIFDAAPVLNEGGDEAIYSLDSKTLAQLADITGESQSSMNNYKIHFYKINGKWYTDRADK